MPYNEAYRDKGRKGMDYDGCSDGRNIAGLFRACMAFGKMVPEAGGRRGVSAGKRPQGGYINAGTGWDRAAAGLLSDLCIGTSGKILIRCERN